MLTAKNWRDADAAGMEGPSRTIVTFAGGLVLQPPNRRKSGSVVPPAPPIEDDADDVGSLSAVQVDATGRGARAIALIRERWWPRARRAFSVISIAAVLAGSVVGGRAAHRWMTRTPRFGARDIDVVGLHHSQRADVLAASGIGENTNVLGLDTARAERRIERLPWVERAHVTRRLPGTVHIEIEERSAVAIVSASGLYLASADGLLFKRVQTGDPDDLTTITGISRADFDTDPDAAREYVRDALALLADVGASSLASRVHIDEIHREATGELSIVLAESGTYVWLGRGPYRAKLSRLSAILAELDRQRLQPAEIHLESDRHAERATVRIPLPDEADETQTSPPVARATTPSPGVAAPAASTRASRARGSSAH